MRTLQTVTRPTGPLSPAVLGALLDQLGEQAPPPVRTPAETRAAVLAAIEANPTLTSPELARIARTSPSTVRRYRSRRAGGR